MRAQRRAGGARRARPRVGELGAEQEDQRDDVDETGTSSRRRATRRSGCSARSPRRRSRALVRPPRCRPRSGSPRQCAASLEPEPGEPVEEQRHHADDDELDRVAHQAAATGSRRCRAPLRPGRRGGRRRRRTRTARRRGARAGRAATTTKSTSFAWAMAARSTLSAASSPMRIDAIIPEAPQRSATSEIRPNAERARRCTFDRRLHVGLGGLRDGKDVEELVDDTLAQLVVLQDEPEDRDQGDRQREEREEHPVRDRGRVLRAAVAEEVLDRPREHAHIPPTRARSAPSGRCTRRARRPRPSIAPVSVTS